MSTSPLLRQSVDAGSMVAVSGQVGFVDGQLVDGGIAAQAHQALQNMLAVLGANGLTKAHLVKVNVYLTTMEDYASMNEEYSMVFDHEPPARTTVAVLELPFGALVELEGWAYRRP